MSTAASVVSSRRKQAKPQRFSNESDSIAGLVNGHGDQLPDCHLCGLCAAKFYDVERFIEHKRTCRVQKQKSITPPFSDTESIPMDLSRKNILDELDNNKNILEDKSNVLFDPLNTLQQHQQQLLELYARLAASQGGVKTDSEQSSEDGHNASYMLSPPSSNDAVEKIHPCPAERCIQRFSSRGALLWHALRRHPDEKLLRCETCEERFSDYDQARDHQCGLAPRSASTGALLRSTSPDVDRGSVPARTECPFSMVSKSPSPAPSSLCALTPSGGGMPPSGGLGAGGGGTTQFSQMLFSQLLNSVSSAAGGAGAGAGAGTQSASSLAKDLALDLSTTIANQAVANAPPFMSIPQMPQHLLRPPMPFGLNPHRPPHPDAFMGSAPSNSLLSNDDDWEALMEVSTTDEAEKIRALVGDKALPTTDPNQCLLCRRVLSCKSALQMHYRTHTGERPFKCKICQRAFTTKGNLKTHMGVHRAKHSFRGIGSAPSVQHQCPICQKRLFTAQLLQQHIAEHTHQLTRNGMMPSFENAMNSPIFERRPEMVCTSSGMVASTSQPLLHMSNAGMIRPLNNGLIPSFGSGFPFFPMGIPRPLASTPQHQNLNPYSTTVLSSPTNTLSSSRPSQTPEAFEPKSEPVNSPPSTPLRSERPLSATLNLKSMLNATLNEVLKKEDSESFITESNSISLSNQGSNVVCSVCFKSFACQSALEIHYRSHTQERPFNCSECGRGFSTKGNMKQHMLTHRIRCAQSPDDGSVDEALSCEEMDMSEPTSSIARYADSESEDRASQSSQSLSLSLSQPQIHSQPPTPHSNSRSGSDSASVPLGTPIPTEPSQSVEQPVTSPTVNTAKEKPSTPSVGSAPNPLDAMQKMWAETEPPPPRQAPVLSKHQCGVCFKHFSSSSALQIHMRTHTGDKPFKCEVCGRAFTTRGNLKVHMGTHMWQQNPSRRGRRIFEFGSETGIHPDLLSPLSGALCGGGAAESPLRAPFDALRGGNAAGGGVPPPGFPSLPFPLPLLPPSSGGAAAAGGMTAAAAASQMDAVMWMWRTVCSVCQKVCSSPHELEQHLKMHLSGTANGTGAGTISPAMLLQKSE